MAIISPETVEEIRQKSDILAVVGDAVQLQRKGSHYVGLCCFHSEKSPSMNVNPVRRSYHCFGCGASGDAITFVMENEGVSFPDALRRLAQRFNVEIKETDTQRPKSAVSDKKVRDELLAMNDCAAQFFIEQARGEWKTLRPYIQSRRLTKESIQQFGLGYAPTDWSSLTEVLKGEGFPEESLLRSGLVRRAASGKLFDLFRARLMFPIHAENGRDILAFGGRIIPGLLPKEDEEKAPKYINSPETPVYKKSATFYGMPQARKAIRLENLVYIVEGYMDVIGLSQAGVHHCLAACGTAFTAQHVERLKHLTKRVHLVFDGDAAGRSAAGKVFPLFLNSGLDARVVFLEREDDPDTLAMREGDRTKEVLEEMPSRSLLRAYVEYLIHQEGLDSVEQLGAARKGRLVETLATVLKGVQNRYERREMAQEAAFLFRVSESQLVNEVAGGASEKKLDYSAPEPSSYSETEMKVLPVSELNGVDQEVVRLAMVGKGDMIAKIFDDPDLCYFLEPSAQLFLEMLAEVYVEVTDEGRNQKEAVQELLASFGPSWVAHWHQAYSFYGEAEWESLEKIFLDCKSKLRVRRLQYSLLELDEELEHTSSAEERGKLLQQKILCERRIREAQAGSH